jgi:hypothetical protein
MHYKKKIHVIKFYTYFLCINFFFLLSIYLKLLYKMNVSFEFGSKIANYSFALCR